MIKNNNPKSHGLFRELEPSPGHQHRDPSDITLKRSNFITQNKVESHWKILSRGGIWPIQPFLPAYLYQEARKNESSYSKLPLQWEVNLWHSSDQWSIRNLTGKASGKDFDFLMNIFPWLSLPFPSLPSLNSGMMSRTVQPSCNHEGKARTIRITPAVTSGTAASKPVASLDFWLWENRNPCSFYFFS